MLSATSVVHSVVCISRIHRLYGCILASAKYDTFNGNGTPPKYGSWGLVLFNIVEEVIECRMNADQLSPHHKWEIKRNTPYNMLVF